MKSYHIDFPWMQQLLPEGIPLPSSTVITGPGGSGKPLIGAMLADAWLEQGGTLVHLLINFGRVYSEKLLRNFEKNLDKYSDRIAYVEFDPEMTGVDKLGPTMLKANLLKPDNLDSAIRQAKQMLPPSELGTLVYSSALNMLLFSPTYGVDIHQKIVELLQSDDNYLFTIANNTFEEQIADWEQKAGNLLFMHGTGIMHLGFKVLKMKAGNYGKEEVSVPITENELYTIRSEAETARKHLIPTIRKI